ncbi:spore germination protein [Neobacillus niacini]|uniref:spore germination protein n=1 Tax=Neobacillus niacini TaxID=86668 RepID=UPI002855E1A3|nr:spore germination protein [Neobacillus niacini]MDR7001685.1 hypothetical protein [Neobacillus niacini]
MDSSVIYIFETLRVLKAYHGSGSSNTGVQIITATGINVTNTVQNDLIDQPISTI